MSPFPYSFADGNWHTIGELREWEAELLKERQADHNFSSSVRRGTKPDDRQKNYRNKELLPLVAFANYRKMSEDTKFCMGLAGSPADAEILLNNGEKLKLQFTIAFPEWHDGIKPGYQDVLINEALEKFDVISTSDRLCRREGSVEREGGKGFSNEELLGALRKGLEIAVEKKSAKRQDGKGIILVVYAKGYKEVTKSLSEFSDLARSAIEKCGGLSFSKVCFLDSRGSWAVEF